MHDSILQQPSNINFTKTFLFHFFAHTYNNMHNLFLNFWIDQWAPGFKNKPITTNFTLARPEMHKHKVRVIKRSQQIMTRSNTNKTSKVTQDWNKLYGIQLQGQRKQKMPWVGVHYTFWFWYFLRQGGGS